MADESQTTQTDEAGLTRTNDGTLADPNNQTSSEGSNQNTNQPSKTEGATLLNQTEQKDGTQETPKETDTKDKSATGAPESYADYNVPEGFTLDKDVKAEADKIFKGMNLSQDQAQSLVDFYVSKTAESAKAPYDAYKKLTDDWRTEALAHPDIGDKIKPGGEINVRIARAIDSIGDAQLAKDFRELMDLTGAGNNQAFIRVIDKLAQRSVEGTFVGGRGPSVHGQTNTGQSAPPTAARAMYPNLPSRDSG